MYAEGVCALQIAAAALRANRFVTLTTQQCRSVDSQVQRIYKVSGFILCTFRGIIYIEKSQAESLLRQTPKVLLHMASSCPVVF